MSKKFFYDSLEDSSRRLQGTVVSYRKSLKDEFQPCYVHQIMGLNTDQMADAWSLPIPVKGGKGEQIPLTPEYFEVRKLPLLGYVDHKGWSHYVSRRSVRQSRQGFHSTNLNIPVNPDTGAIPQFNTLLSSKEFVGMLRGEYDPFGKVFDTLMTSDEPIMKAFSKTMALSIDDMESVSLWNRGVRVAVSNNPKKYGPVFKLPQKYRYLTEELEEQRIRVE